jgi:hypothetical protein
MADIRKRTTKENPTFELVDLDALTDEERSEFDATAPLFRISGRTWEARTTFSAGECIEYARIWRQQGIDDAVAYAMDKAVGEDGWKAFTEYPYLSNGKATQIIGEVISRIGWDAKAK